MISPQASSSFVEPPLSTKRERLAIPARIASVPRAARTAPARSRYVHHRFELQRPHLVSFKGGEHETVLNSPAYNPEYEATYFDQVFQYIKKLGEGSFGEVVCVKSREDQRLYAVKRVLDPFRSESDRKAKLREVQKHELIPPHSNILEFFKAWEERGRLYIQTELCEQSLAEYTQLVHPVPENEVWNFFMDIARAVDHLHNHNLLHMDIKPENILMTKDKICKLGDFGRVFDLKNDKKDSAEEGDSKYLAKEVLNNAPTKAADIFSVGMTVLEIATDMELPSQGLQWHHIREGNIPERFFIHVSTELRGHIMHMIHQDPNLRPTSKQLLQIFATTMRSRKKHIYVHELKNKMINALWTIYLYILAIIATIKELFQSCGTVFFPKDQPVPRTPVAVRLPIASVDLDYSYSDDEGQHSRSFLYGHQRRTSHYPENPNPRYRLNFDDDTASSASVDSQTSLPDIQQGTPPSARQSINPASRQTSRGPFFPGPSGDWDMGVVNDDSDSDDELVFRRGTMTAPPRLPMRSAYRNRAKRPPPRLNLHLLDSPETTDPPIRETTPPLAQLAEKTPRRRARNIQQRLISNDSSADEL